MPDVKLQALDAEDLAVLSAHCQDAVIRVGDMTFQARERRFALVANRFDWAEAGRTASGARSAYTRRRAGLRFEKVRRVRVTRLDPKAADTVLSLLAITFVPTDSPSGELTLTFADGGALKLDVDCIEVELTDLGAAWTTEQRPEHGIDGDDPTAPTRTGGSGTS
jgi:hypothetical protein